MSVPVKCRNNGYIGLFYYDEILAVSRIHAGKESVYLFSKTIQEKYLKKDW